MKTLSYTQTHIHTKSVLWDLLQYYVQAKKKKKKLKLENIVIKYLFLVWQYKICIFILTKCNCNLLPNFPSFIYNYLKITRIWCSKVFAKNNQISEKNV